MYTKIHNHICLDIANATIGGQNYAYFVCWVWCISAEPQGFIYSALSPLSNFPPTPMHDYLLDLSEPSNQTVQATVTHPRRLPTLEWVTIQDLQNPDTYRASFMTFTIKRETPYCWSEHLQKMAFQSKTTEMDPYCCSVSLYKVVIQSKTTEMNPHCCYKRLY